MSKETVTLEAEARQSLGTRECRRLRKAGQIPAVVYGHGEDNASVAVPTKLTTESIMKGNHLFNLDISGKAQSVLLKDIQFDPFGINILHLDFARISLDEIISVLVPINFVGDAKGLVEGGIVEHEHTEVEVSCRADSIPDQINANVEALGVGDSLHVSDLTFPEGVTPLFDADTVVAHVAAPRVVADDDEPTDSDGAPKVLGQEDEMDSPDAENDGQGPKKDD